MTEKKTPETQPSPATPVSWLLVLVVAVALTSTGIYVGSQVFSAAPAVAEETTPVVNGPTLADVEAARIEAVYTTAIPLLTQEWMESSISERAGILRQAQEMAVPISCQESHQRLLTWMSASLGTRDVRMASMAGAASAEAELYASWLDSYNAGK
jgi:hypothetical protein